MNNPILGIDTWEGQLEIDEAVLKANGVAFIFVRLNDMNGGHHKDTGFDKQWGEAKNFYRAPYFVYNPWVSGSANFLWLQSNMPADAKAVAVDIEVRMAGYSPVVYAAEVAKFEALLKGKWNYVIYTGEWFLSYISTWNQNADYWWAQYPSEFYPPNTLSLTWDDLRQRLVKYSGPGNVSKVPGRLKFWQFSGDRLILPGNVREMDVNVFLGTLTELESFMGGVHTAPPIEENAMFYGRNKTTLTNIRSGAGGNFADIGDLLLNDEIEADRKQNVGGVDWWHLTKITRGGAQVTLPGVDCWCWGTNIEEHAAPPNVQSIFITHDFSDTLTLNGVTYTATYSVPNVEYKPKP